LPRRIESLFIDGPAGKLEALLEEPDHTDAREAVLICHPHPQHGGTMHNKVVYRMARGLRRAGAVALRFNYRGVNLSEGAYAGGEGEVEDARAVLGALRSRYPDLPFSLAGFSFGARVILRLGCEVASVRRLIAVGFPASYWESERLGRCDAPRIYVQSTHDQFGPREAMQKYFDSLDGPKRLLWVEAQDHFFAGALPEFEETMFSLGAGEGALVP